MNRPIERIKSFVAQVRRALAGSYYEDVGKQAAEWRPKPMYDSKTSEIDGIKTPMNDEALRKPSGTTYGYDPASPGGDTSALTIRFNSKVFTFVGEEADAILHLISEDRERVAREAYKKMAELNPLKNYVLLLGASADPDDFYDAKLPDNIKLIITADATLKEVKDALAALTNKPKQGTDNAPSNQQ